MAYDPDARRTLSRGIDARLELAACRRLGDASCPYDGVRPPNVIERATQLGAQLGPVVVVIVGYNDYEANYAANIEQALSVFTKAGVPDVRIRTLEGTARFPSIEQWVYTDVKGWTLAEMLDDAQFTRLLREAETALRPFVMPDATVAFPISAHIATLTKR